MNIHLARILLSINPTENCGQYSIHERYTQCTLQHVHTFAKGGASWMKKGGDCSIGTILLLPTVLVAANITCSARKSRNSLLHSFSCTKYGWWLLLHLNSRKNKTAESRGINESTKIIPLKDVKGIDWSGS